MYTERDIGIYSFLSTTPGIGGKLRKNIDDFYVEEIPIDIPKNPAGRHLCLRIRLRNWETNRFVKILSRHLGISRHRIKFAGIKDKRAVTVQYFCIMNYKGKVSINIKDVEIIDAFHTDYTLNIGDLLGNRFDVLISNTTCDDRVTRIEEELAGLFPNFFGVQRFGASRPITHIVGKHIIRGQYEEAVRYYIGYPSSFQEDEGRRIFFDTLDAREAIKNISRIAEYERAILNHLITNPMDYVGALRKLPENLLLLFVHGYQAYIFNRILSERLKIGLDLQKGDVVMKVDSRLLPAQEFVTVDSFNIDTLRKRVKEKKAYLSTILPGYATTWSGGVQGEIERDIMEDEGVSFRDFRIKELSELSSKGRRRNMLSPILDYWREGCEFRFTLHPGSYATSLLREFMKSEDLQYY